MLYEVFFPVSYTRMYLQCMGALILIVVIFNWSAISLTRQLHRNVISGRVLDVKVGTIGGSISRFAGSSTQYHIQVEGYKRNFLLTDGSVFENWQINPVDIKIGDRASFTIKATDVNKLQIPTEYEKRGGRMIPWPLASSSTKIYGITINGKPILSTASTVRGQVYQRWFWVMVPLFIYAIFALFVRTQFKYWTPSAEQRYLDRLR